MNHVCRRKRNSQWNPLPTIALIAVIFWGGGNIALSGELPSGGSISAGSGAINQADGQMTIDQASSKMAIDWQRFSVGRDNSVTFNQPSASAVALNRVRGSDVSTIQGAINANGQVFLLNPNGVLFSPAAQVNVGGLVASTLEMSNEDFLVGNYTFSGDSPGSIVNQGLLNAAEGGYITLIAAKIENSGEINAPQGDVLMGAGQRVTLDMGGPVKLNIEQGALDTLIDNGGAIRADGGMVYLTAKSAGDLAVSVINHDGVIEAQTLEQGANGSIMLMGDMEQGQVFMNGTLDASAPQSGDGGFVETSAAEVHIGEQARVSTLAEDGVTGTWLIDPSQFTIEEGTAAQTTSGIGNQTLVSNLSSNDIQIIDNGMIDVNADVIWSDPTSLELTAQIVGVNARIENTNTTEGGVFFSGIMGGDYDVEFTPDGVIGINNLQQLGWVNTAKNLTEDLSSYTVVGNYELGADIDASATRGWGWSLGAGFEPIGPGYSTPFVGTFDGKGYNIDGLYTNSGMGDYVGLFGHAINANIQDLSLTNLDVTGLEFVGGLAGFARDSVISGVSAAGTVTGAITVGGLAGYDNGIISNSSAAVDVTGASIVGGLVGHKDPGEVSQSYATGSVTQNHSDGQGAGGLIGRLYSASVSQSYATGDVSAEGDFGYVGGLVGQMVYASSPSIDASYATGHVSSTADRTGGLVGSVVGTVTNSYFTGTVTSTGNKVGGFAGELLSSSSIENSYSTATINADAGAVDVGGFVGYVDPPTTDPVTSDTTPGGTVTSSFWDYEASGVPVPPDFRKGIPLSSSDMKNPKYYFNWDSNTWSIPEGSNVAGYEVGLPYLTNVTLTADVPNRSTLFDDGFGTSADPWAITDWAQLARVASPDPLTQWHFALQNDLGTGTAGYNTLVADGDVLANGDIGWRPIGEGLSGFTGVFDGGNHQIDSLKISDTNLSGRYKGLFGYVRNGARITDLQLSNVDIKGTAYIGSLAGSAEQDVHIENVQVNGGSVSGIYRVGGLVGCFDAAINSIQDSHVNLDVSGDSRVGGLVGDMHRASIRNSTFAGTVSGREGVGGLVGIANDASITGSSSSANIQQLADPVNNDGFQRVYFFGGLIGHASLSTLENNSATGDIQIINGSNVHVGGAIGYAAATTLDSIQTSGTIDVKDADDYLTVGGLVGQTHVIVDRSTGTTIPTSIVGSQASNTLTVEALEGGNISGSGIGGLVGILRYDNRIERSSATGNVSASGINAVGGLVGMNENSHIEQSFATGRVEGQDSVGGLVGLMQNASKTIVNSYATGDVVGRNRVGGLVGYLGDSSIASSYATGEVSGLDYVGGLVGFSENSTISNSFWDVQTTNQATGVGETDADNVPGLSTLDMKDISTFSASGWDISAQGGEDTVWRIYEGDTYPLLRAHFKDTVTATLTADDRSYDGTTLLTGADFSLPAEFNRDLVLKSDPLAYVSDDKNAGTRNIVLEEGSIYSNQEGYDLIITPSTVEITPADLTITANADTKTYDGLAYSGANGVTYAGFVNGEEEDVLAGTLNYSGTSQGAVNTGEYVITPEGLNGSNYTITFNNGTLSITPRPITITADDKSKVYGNNDPALTYQVTDGNLVGSDTLSGTLSREAGENVGSYTIDASALENGNYLITTVNGALTITPAQLAVTADSHTREYGEINPALTFSAEGFKFNEDTSVLSGALNTAADQDSSAGDYAIEQGTLSADHGNYIITFHDGILTVTPTPEPAPEPEPINDEPVQVGAARYVAQSLLNKMPSTSVDSPAFQAIPEKSDGDLQDDDQSKGKGRAGKTVGERGQKRVMNAHGVTIIDGGIRLHQ